MQTFLECSVCPLGEQQQQQQMGDVYLAENKMRLQTTLGEEVTTRDA